MKFFAIFKQNNICYRVARDMIMNEARFSNDIVSDIRTQQLQGKWPQVFTPIGREADLEVTFYALKEAVAFLISITVVIPSDETIWKIIHSLGAGGMISMA